MAEQKEKKPLVPYLQQQSIMEPTNKKSKTDPMENKWERDLSSIGANVRGMRAELTKFVNSTIRKEVFDELLSAANFAATTGNKVAVAEYQLAIVALVKKNNTARNKEFCEDVYELAEPNSSGEDIPDMSILPADCQPNWNPPKQEKNAGYWDTGVLISYFQVITYYLLLLHCAMGFIVALSGKCGYGTSCLIKCMPLFWSCCKAPQHP